MNSLNADKKDRTKSWTKGQSDIRAELPGQVGRTNRTCALKVGRDDGNLVKPFDDNLAVSYYYVCEGNSLRKEMYEKIHAHFGGLYFHFYSCIL